MSVASLSPLYVILVVKHWTRGVYDGHVFGGAWVRFSRPLSSSLGRGRDTTAAVDPLTARAYNRSSSGTKDVARREFVSILGGGGDDDVDPDQVQRRGGMRMKDETYLPSAFALKRVLKSVRFQDCEFQ